MGAWGYGIRDDDFVRDVIGEFEDRLKAGNSAADATTAVKSKFGSAIEDSVDGPLFWIALADMQWTYGGLETFVLRYLPMGFRKVKDRLEIVGQVEILDSDLKDSDIYFRWSSIGEDLG